MKKKIADSQLLSNLYGLISDGQARDALIHIQQFLNRYPKDPNGLHLAALANAALGNTNEAHHFFNQTLKLNIPQPTVHNNYANFLKQQNQYEPAKHHYLQATSLAPKFGEAWRNLAILEYEINELSAAFKYALAACDNSPSNPAIYSLLGNICRKSNRLDSATDYFQTAIDLKPDYANAIYGLAITYSALEQSDKALPLLEKALQLRPSAVEILYAKALAQLNLGEYLQAESTLAELLNDYPLYIDAHRTLNEIYWQQGNKIAFCASYKRIPSPQRKVVNIAIAHVESLLAADRSEDAKQELESRWRSSNDPRVIFLKGRVEEEQGDIDAATLLYEQAFTHLPELSIAKQFFTALIKSDQIERANQLISAYQKNAANDQLLWAQQGTCWKMLDDSRYHWLTRDNAFIQRFEIPIPNGYSSRNLFLDELTDTLTQMHNLKARPLNQSVRAGIQTPGRLLHKQHPVIQTLRNSLNELVAEYIAAMPKDSGHPLLRRKSEDFAFSGSWSVLLKRGGHHVSHVHPQGWISSSFYVSVPESTSSSTLAGGEGDIYFGRSPYNLGPSDTVEKHLTPTAGSLVLFPSYTWHGTIPLPESSSETRLTTPFDVIPLLKI